MAATTSLTQGGSLQEGPPQSPPGKLVLAIDVIRHGDRTPEVPIPTVKYSWPEGLGQLTPTGILQEKELGDKLKKRYAQQQLFFDSQNLEMLHVFCSGYGRTITSASSFLMGLFPHGTQPGRMPCEYQQNISLDTLFGADDFMVPDNSNGSFDFAAYAQANVFTTPEWQNAEKALQPHFAEWSTLTGKTITKLYDLKSLGDTLDISEKNGAPLPVGLSSEDRKSIIKAGEWAYWHLYQNQTLSQAASARLLQSIESYLQGAVQSTQPLKYILYSAHSSTLMAVLNALGAPLQAVPPYASDFNLSLYDQGNGSYALQFSYNDRPVTLPCTNSASCSLAQFHALVVQAMAALTTLQSEFPPAVPTAAGASSSK